MTLKESEFIATDDLRLHYLDDQPSANVKDATEIMVNKGDKIPEIFIPNFLRYNRQFLANLVLEASVPQLTPEQVKKYSYRTSKVSKTFKEEVDKSYQKYTMEDLTVKLSELKSKNFKEWAEKEFGADKIDKRKGSQNIIVDILQLQDEGLI